jgi:hypothetical protein
MAPRARSRVMIEMAWLSGSPVVTMTSRRVVAPSIRDITKYSSGPTPARIGSKLGDTRSFCEVEPIPGISTGTLTPARVAKPSPAAKPAVPAR